MKNSINFHEKYYGGGDLAGSIFLKTIIDNIDNISSQLYFFQNDINSIEDLIAQLWILEFKKMVDDLPLYKIGDDIKTNIKSLNEKLNFNFKEVTKFINNKYESIFDKAEYEKDIWFDYFPDTFELIYTKLIKGINEDVLRFLEKHHSLQILSQFDICLNYYKNNIEYFESLFLELDSTNKYDDFIYCDFLQRFYGKIDGDFLCKKADWVCHRGLDNIKAENLSEDNENVLQVQSHQERYYRLAIQYKLPIANELLEVGKSIKETINKYVAKHGAHHDFGPIDLQPAIDILKKDTNSYKFIQLTHSNKNGTITNKFDEILNLKNNSVFSEFVNEIGRPRSDKYPYFKQQHMDIQLSIDGQIIIKILIDEKLKEDFGNYLCFSANSVSKYFDDKIQIGDELIGIYEVLLNLISMLLNKQSEATIFKALVNSAALLICGVIEKLLRAITIKNCAGIEYVDPNSCTVMTMLTSTNLCLSEGLKYYLEYYLSNENNQRLNRLDRPGRNLRNKHMHNYDDTYSRTTLDECILLFELLLSLVDEILVIDMSERENELK